MVYVFIGILVCFSSSVNAAFENTNWSARGVFLGATIVSSPDSTSMVTHNPAGITQTTNKNLQGMYGIPFTGLSNLNFNYSSIYFTTEIKDTVKQVIGIGMTNFNAEVYGETSGIISYGRLVSGKDKKCLYLGANLKYMWNSYNIPDNEDVSGQGNPVITGDFGMLYADSDKNLSVGAVVKNVNEPVIGSSIPETIPREILASATMVKYLSKSVIDKIIFSIGMRNDSINSELSLSSELVMHKNFSVGIGYTPLKYTFGFSYNHQDKYRLDYTYGMPIQFTGTRGGHYMSVTIKL